MLQWRIISAQLYQVCGRYEAEHQKHERLPLQHQNCAVFFQPLRHSQVVKRAHRQAIVWHSLDNNDQPELDSELFGWMKDSMKPTHLPVNTELAPEYIMCLIKCGRKSAIPCNTRVCSCISIGLNCTIFYGCRETACCQRVRVFTGSFIPNTIVLNS